MSAIQEGIVSGLAVFALSQLLLFIFKYRSELTDFVLGRANFSHLSGKWEQYHLTKDKANVNNEVWVHNTDMLSVNKVRNVNGDSENHYTTKLFYKIKGRIDDNRLVIKYYNKNTSEKGVVVYVDNVLSKDILHGIWIGYDFDQHLTVGPIIYSRIEMNDTELESIIRNYRLNIIAEPKST